MTTSKAATLSLYRSILRSHSKSLPPEMRKLGDAYVKAEFRQHKDVTDTNQLGKFFTEWNMYLNHVRETARAKETKAAGLGVDNKQVVFGMDLDEGVEMTDEQKLQLQNLREEATKIT